MSNFTTKHSLYGMILIILITFQFTRSVTSQSLAAAGLRNKVYISNTFYISPNGSDSNLGTEASIPWKTFSFAIPRLGPGDILILLDGTYQKDTTGLPHINCGDTKYATNGTSDAPITIKAQNERHAFLKSDGSVEALYMKDCSYWNIIGLRGRSADLSELDGGQQKSVFKIKQSSNVNLKRILGTHSNRYFNVHTYEITSSSGILIEESESYYFHRHGFNFYKCRNVVIRRSYANSRDYSDLEDGYASINPDGGDESFVFYYTSDSIIENSISHGNNLGFEIHGGPNFDSSPGGHNNQILGSIYLDGQQYGARIDTRKVDGVVWQTDNNLFMNFLAIFTGRPGITLSSTSGARIENATIYHAGGDGIQSKETDPNDEWCDNFSSGCSFSVTNSLIFDGAKHGIRIRNNTDWLVEYSNLVNNPHGNFNLSELNLDEDISDGEGHIQYSKSITPSGLGLNYGKTWVYIPSDSNMKGKGKNKNDIGANILFRYESGFLTRQPLWDPATGGFPCGAIITDINDIPGSSCFDVHIGLNVNADTLPIGYGLPTYFILVFLPITIQ